MSVAALNPPLPNMIPLPTSMPHPAGGLPYPVGACKFLTLSLYRLYLGIRLVTYTRMAVFYATQSGLSTKEKTRFSTLLRRGSPPSGTPVPASVREPESLQPVKTMKPFCARLSGRWTLEKSLFSNCRRDGRKHLFPRLTSLYHLYRRNGKPRGRLRCYRKSSLYGSGPRANLARGGYEAPSSMPRILRHSSASFSYFIFVSIPATQFLFIFFIVSRRGHYLSFSFSFSYF